VALNRFAAARLVFILGILLSSLESSRASGARGQGAENGASSAPPTPVKPIGDTLPLGNARHSRDLWINPRGHAGAAAAPGPKVRVGLLPRPDAGWVPTGFALP
jgi:hypothetical protein